METIVRDIMVSFLEDKLIKDSQHGFRNRRSYLTNVLDFFSDIKSMYDDSRSVDIIYLDFRKRLTRFVRTGYSVKYTPTALEIISTGGLRTGSPEANSEWS